MDPSTSTTYGERMRITTCKSQGGRKYMEDSTCVRVERSDDGSIDYIFLGVFDGHGGSDASKFAADHLLQSVVSQKLFYSDNDEDVLKAIREGFIETHHAMWKEVDNWPRTASGYTSTSGTTATVAFIRRGKLYTGHVGDSCLVMGEWESRNDKQCLIGHRLTVDHKPDSPEELKRIKETGGEIMNKAGVYRVVWNRPRRGHIGPVRRSTAIDKIPFLAVARSLGDLWSYNSNIDSFVVSPEPDVSVTTLGKQHACIILGSDGLWNVVRAQDSVDIINVHEWKEYDSPALEEKREYGAHSNHSRQLVRHALLRWGNLRADNISVIVAVFDLVAPPHVSPTAGRSCVIQPSVSVGLVDDDIFDDRVKGSPDLMLRVLPNITQVLRTHPVELLYFGQMDAPPMHRSASFPTPQFTLDSMPKSAELLDGADEVADGDHEVATVPLSAGITDTRPRFYCSKHGLLCTKAQEMNRMSVASGVKFDVPDQTRHALLHGRKPKYWCRKHGLACKRVKGMNEEYERQRALGVKPDSQKIKAEFAGADHVSPTSPSTPVHVRPASTGRKSSRRRVRTIPRVYNTRQTARTTRSGLRLSPTKSTPGRRLPHTPLSSALRHASTSSLRVSGMRLSMYTRGVFAKPRSASALARSPGNSSSLLRRSRARSCSYRDELTQSMSEMRLRSLKRNMHAATVSQLDTGSGQSSTTPKSAITRMQLRRYIGNADNLAAQTTKSPSETGDFFLEGLNLEVVVSKRSGTSHEGSAKRLAGFLEEMQNFAFLKSCQRADGGVKRRRISVEGLALKTKDGGVSSPHSTLQKTAGMGTGLDPASLS